MKKILLTLIIGIFLFGTVNSLSITVEEPFETPTLNSVTNETGGSWEAGNYNFKIFTTDTERVDSNRRRSISSNSVNITLNENNKVILNYSIPSETDSPTDLYVIYQKDGERWTFYNRFLISLTTYPTEIELSDTPYETTSFRYTALENYEYRGTSMWGLNTSKGVSRIRVTGNSGSLTVPEIITELRNSSLVEGEDYLIAGDYSIYSTASLWFDTTGGTIDISGSHLSFFGGIYSPDIVTRIVANPLNSGSITFLSTPQRGGFVQGVRINNIEGAAIVDGDAFKCNAYGLTGGHQSTLYGELKASLVSTQYSTVSPDLTAGSIYHSTSSIRFWANEDYRDIIAIGNNAYLIANLKDIYDTDIYTKNTGYQIFWLPNDEKGINLYDVNFYYFYTEEKYNYDEIVYRDYNLYGVNTSIKYFNSINLKIIQENGTIIPNASIIVKDKDENIVINTTTDENGTISEYIQTFQHNNIDEEGVITGGGYNTNPNPFTFEVSKSGYETIVFSDTVNEKRVDWKLTMKPVKKIRFDINGDTYLALSAEKGSGAKFYML